MERKPGPQCGLFSGLKWLDPGTLARTRHTPPGPVGRPASTSSDKRQQLTDAVAVPFHVNVGLSAPSERFMLTLLGRPRKKFSQICEPVTNNSLANFMEVFQLANIKIRGLRPAVASLKIILLQIKISHPAIYHRLGTVGMLCCRNQRRSIKISNHSWGTAIDLTICGKLDDYGDCKVQRALAAIAPIFNRNGWVWGAAYRKEDGMHFEVSREKLLKWQAQGALPEKSDKHVQEGRGASADPAKPLQLLLNKKGAQFTAKPDFCPFDEEVKQCQMTEGLLNNDNQLRDAANPDGLSREDK